MIQLSESQKYAFDYIVENLPTKKVILLEGSAGTGKTTLTKYICNYYNEKKNTLVCAIAPTHKSKKVIKNILNQNTIIPISAFTVASALGKIKEHSYVGTKQYTNGNIKKLSSYKLFIVDEVSMIKDTDLKIIVDYVNKTNKQLLIIGDSNQIPCPSAKYIVSNIIEKADSYVFTDEKIDKVKLTITVRQSEDSPIIKLATFVRDNLLNDFTFDKIIESTNFTNVIQYSDTYSIFKQHFNIEEVNSCRIIAYTNSAVKMHNMEVRDCLGYKDVFVVGELMTGYTNIGWPDLIIENGEDYIIKNICPTTTHRIGTFKNLSGNLIDMIVSDNSSKVKIRNLFFINIHSSNNTTFIMRLIELAEKINDLNSTKLDYRNYMELKNCVVFTEDVYKYEGKIFTETTFKETHPLLFVNINEVITGNQIIRSLLSKKINTTYSEIVQQRMDDKHKPLGDSETFADKYKVIEKDINYGYSITAHKSQGSTYNTALVDEPDFQKISNRWNYKYDKLETRVKEKNQLRYVAYTRAKSNLYLIYQDKDKENDMDMDMDMEYEVDEPEYEEVSYENE